MAQKHCHTKTLHHLTCVNPLSSHLCHWLSIQDLLLYSPWWKSYSLNLLLLFLSKEISCSSPTIEVSLITPSKASSHLVCIMEPWQKLEILGCFRVILWLGCVFWVIIGEKSFGCSAGLASIYSSRNIFLMLTICSMQRHERHDSMWGLSGWLFYRDRIFCTVSNMLLCTWITHPVTFLDVKNKMHWNFGNFLSFSYLAGELIHTLKSWRDILLR